MRATPIRLQHTQRVGEALARKCGWSPGGFGKTFTLLCLCAFTAGCSSNEPSKTLRASAVAHVVTSPENTARITPGAITYPAGRTYRITRLDSNTMKPDRVWVARGETISEDRDGVTFRDQQTGAVMEVRGTYRLTPIPKSEFQGPYCGGVK